MSGLSSFVFFVLFLCGSTNQALQNFLACPLLQKKFCPAKTLLPRYDKNHYVCQKSQIKIL